MIMTVLALNLLKMIRNQVIVGYLIPFVQREPVLTPETSPEKRSVQHDVVLTVFVVLRVIGTTVILVVWLPVL